MKKTFQLQIEGKHPERLLEAIKHEIRSYQARERRKALPKDAHFWDFDCRIGETAESAETIRLGTLTERINEIAASGAQQFYVELLVKPGVHQTPVIPQDPEA